MKTSYKQLRVEKLSFELLRHKFTTLVIVVVLYEEGEVKNVWAKQYVLCDLLHTE